MSGEHEAAAKSLDAADWCLLTQTEGGKVSLIKGLTAGEAREAARRVAPAWMRPGAAPFGRLHITENTIRSVEIFRGTGETLDFRKDW